MTSLSRTGLVLKSCSKNIWKSFCFWKNTSIPTNLNLPFWSFVSLSSQRWNRIPGFNPAQRALFLLHVGEEANLPQCPAPLRSPPALQRGDGVDLTSASCWSLTLVLLLSLTRLDGPVESSSPGVGRVVGVLAAGEALGHFSAALRD